MVVSLSNKQVSAPELKPEVVLVVHGIVSHPLWMAILCKRLREANMPTINWGYRSYVGSIEKHARSLNQAIDKALCEAEVVHLVAHSMGCILVRKVLEDRGINRIGRVVFLTPPNQGSPVARRIAPWVRWFCPALEQLSDAEGSFVRSLPNPPYPFGVIAADYDFVVPTGNTKIPVPHEHLSVATMHNGVLFNREVFRQTLHFLRYGTFLKSNLARIS